MHGVLDRRRPFGNDQGGGRPRDVNTDGEAGQTGRLLPLREELRHGEAPGRHVGSLADNTPGRSRAVGPLVMALVGRGVAVGTPVGTQTSIWICWITDNEEFCVASNSTGVCSHPVTIILK